MAAISAAGAVTLALLPLAPVSAAEGEGSPRLSAGVRAIAGDRVLGTVTVASSLGQLGPGALAVVAAVATAQRRPRATGWLLAAIAVGGLGSLWWTWRPSATERAARTVMFALLGIGTPWRWRPRSPRRCRPGSPCPGCS